MVRSYDFTLRGEMKVTTSYSILAQCKQIRPASASYGWFIWATFVASMAHTALLVRGLVHMYLPTNIHQPFLVRAGTTLIPCRHSFDRYRVVAKLDSDKAATSAATSTPTSSRALMASLNTKLDAVATPRQGPGHASFARRVWLSLDLWRVLGLLANIFTLVFCLWQILATDVRLLEYSSGSRVVLGAGTALHWAALVQVPILCCCHIMLYVCWPVVLSNSL